MAKVEAIEYGDRKVFSVAAFNRGLADWLGRLPTVWVEGEVTELRRQERWQTVFFTLKDKDGSACVEAALPRRRFDALGLDLTNGERVHVYGRPEVWPQKGSCASRCSRSSASASAPTSQPSSGSSRSSPPKGSSPPSASERSHGCREGSGSSPGTTRRPSAT